MTGPTRLRPPEGQADLPAALRVLAEAEAADGVRPLSEQAELALRGHAAPEGALLLVTAGPGAEELLGVVHLQAADGEEPAVAELVVAPSARGQGHGATLLAAVRRAAGAPGLRVWAHGGLPAARALAERAGGRPARLLHQMRRPLSGPDAPPLPATPPLPEGVRLRPFRPGADDEGWVAVNAAAFASHPEQGRWTVADLRARQAEPWFDPAGFLVAERKADGAILGFHWTKTHGRPGSPDALGEVYVVGVAPAAQGLGLGRSLVLAGLEHLVRSGIPTGMLYVDDDNTAAMRLYRGLGFAPVMTDALYALPPLPSEPLSR